MRFLTLTVVALAGLPVRAETPAKPLFAGRLIYQDHATATLKWADVRVSTTNEYSLTPIATVPGFPALDGSKQKLVQMKGVENKVLVGVRDTEDGKVGSGWVMLSTNVKYHDHGDHGHWTAKGPPAVLGSRIDADQGNPAHLYEYGGKFYLANDRKNGYTRFDPAEWFQTVGGEAKGGTPRFTPGGGNHITLAVANDAVGYSCWIDGGGPNAGKVDVTPVGAPAIKYSFALPSGVIHGVTVCANKVFFAPADGLCWVEADTRLALTGDQVKVNHVSLGKSGDKPNRTGAFSTHASHVLCVTGRESLAKLVLVRATAADLKPVFVPLHGKAGNKPVTPAVIDVDKKSPTAFVFHDHDRETDAEDVLEVIALDPDGNKDYADARLVKVLKVSPSAVSGHFGHHAIAFDADGRVAFITNPGDGTISVLDLLKLEIKATFKVGGVPTALVAHGGRDAED